MMRPNLNKPPRPPRTRAIMAIARGYENHLSGADIEFIVDTTLAALREPTKEQLDAFIDELSLQPDQTPDPGEPISNPAAHPSLPQPVAGFPPRELRLRLTWAWRRAIDQLKDPTRF